MSGRSVFAMILAAGQSRRMGRAKQLLPYDNGTIIEAVIAAVLESSVDGLVIVANPEVEEFLRGYLPERCFITINDDPDSEMLTSVKIGLQTIRQEFEPAAGDGIMVLLGDQPQITGGTITTCAEAFRLPRRPPGALVATYKKHRGHPTIFSMELLEEIEEWPKERKLSDLLDGNPEYVRELPITAQAMPIDVDTPEDYDKLVPP
ncbi:MAG TPA: nucleotidyltransferase family protein [Phycisphaerae bacterium]|nr:nucleotidyltransferase family protein [Phycisphaerae bacterium]